MAEAISLATILQDEDVLLDATFDTKAALFGAAAVHLGRTTGVASDVLLKALAEREKLGSTAINRGIAVPHAGIEALAAPAAVLYRLAQPIEFEASDNNPVDLVFALVWPSDKRSGLLATLGELCRSLRAEALLHEVRDASTPAEVRTLLEQASRKAAERPTTS